MSDTDEKQAIYPLPDAQWLAERKRAIAEREARADDDVFATIRGVAERMIARFAPLPCQGEVAKIPACSDLFASSCAERPAPGCPRNIAAFEEERRIDARLERLRAAGVPEKAAVLVTSAALREEIPLRLVREWLASGTQHLALCGSKGVGKSVAAAHAVFVTGGAWISASESGAIAIEERERMKRAESANLLVIDDVGTEIDKGWSVATITKLVCNRADRSLRTLLTTNLSRTDFEQLMGPRAVDRILGDGRIHEYGGPSLRGAK